MAKPANPRPAAWDEAFSLDYVAAAIVQTFRRWLYRSDFCGGVWTQPWSPVRPTAAQATCLPSGENVAHDATRPVISMDHNWLRSIFQEIKRNEQALPGHRAVRRTHGGNLPLFSRPILCSGPQLLCSSALDALQDSARHGAAHCAVQQHCRHASEVWTTAAWRGGS